MCHHARNAVVLLACLLPLAAVAATGPPQGPMPSLAMRYQDAWYQENGLQDVGKAVEAYRAVAEAEGAEPALVARALLRMAACYRQLGDEAAAGAVELTARRRFPDEIAKFPTHRLEVLEKQLDEAFNVGDTTTAGQAIVRFLTGLDVATVHSICESVYDQASARRRSDPLASIPTLRKAIAISTYLRQIERSAFAQKEIGDIYMSAGRPDEAIAAYRKVQQNFARSKNAGAWAQVSIAEVHRLRGRLAEAVEAYRAVERDCPGQIRQVLWANLWMGDAFRVAGRTADAQAAWRHVLEDLAEPDYADLMAIAARLLGQAEPGQSVDVADDEFANDVAYFLAVEHEMAGRRNEARRLYRRCIALSKGNDWPRALAARALEPRAEP